MSSTETDVTIAVVLRVEDLNTRSALAHLLQNAFLASGITSVVEQPPPPEKKGGEEAFILLATASTAAIDMEGEHLSYLKKTTSGERLEFAVSDAASFQGHGTSAFWSGAEKGELTLSIMERVVVDPAKLSPLLPSTLNEKKKSAILALPSLMHSLQHAGLVEEPFPLHNQKRRVDMWAKSMYSLYAPLDELYAYFGACARLAVCLQCSPLSPPQTPTHPPRRHIIFQDGGNTTTTVSGRMSAGEKQRSLWWGGSSRLSSTNQKY